MAALGHLVGKLGDVIDRLGAIPQPEASKERCFCGECMVAIVSFHLEDTKHSVQLHYLI